MIRASALCALALPALLLSGCSTLGGNVSGEFACRAPEGNCAPLGAIDARASASLAEGPAIEATPVRGGQARGGPARAEPGDLTRTRERMLRIVFPAHVDAYGVFHDEAVAWTIAEPSDWAARERGLASEPAPRALARAIAERLEAARGGTATAQAPAPEAELELSDDLFLPLASPSAHPSTAREAIAGASAPGPEGFDTSDMRDRTPRSSLGRAPLAWPSIEAIDAAHARTAKAPPDADASRAAAPVEEPRR